jgi:NTP pyrophosphatase (non-canonical NTP hydrolase)
MSYPSYDTTASQYQKKLVELNKRGYKDPKEEGQLAIYSLGIGGESGEVLELIKRYFRGDTMDIAKFKLQLKKELGDLSAYMALVAYVFDIDMSDVLDANLEKLRERVLTGTQLGSGSDR